MDKTPHKPIISQERENGEEVMERSAITQERENKRGIIGGRRMHVECGRGQERGEITVSCSFLAVGQVSDGNGGEMHKALKADTGRRGPNMQSQQTIQPSDMLISSAVDREPTVLDVADLCSRVLQLERELYGQ